MAPSLRVPDFSTLKVAVVGDLIADHYLVTEPRGLSREAPVMVLRFVSDYILAGGASNVARNLRAMGAQTRVLGAVGRDARGRELVELLENEDIDVEGMETVPGWVTPTKTRVVAAEARRNLQQVLRVDREPSAAVDESARARVRDELRRLKGEIDVLLVSDYEYGMIDGAMAETAMELVRGGTIVVLDPRSRLEGFEGVSALTPNVGELARFTNEMAEDLNDAGELTRAAKALQERLRCQNLLVTRGNLGMALFGPDVPEDGVAVEASGSGNVTDVSGAGDTAAAVFGLSLAAGLDGPSAMQVANAASGVVVMENGAAVCTPAQLREAFPASPGPARMPVAGR